eukprot:TRINITY_DN715_c0_g1_i16.p1 TRINITY_DN715_c0_g1~~TRINITY_DN715_c0_g1_i16.p1  ORF type:complete len:369 (-),score=87.80 TRINITY_DN715_c0_g1_i16:94-1200(-)
MCIRDRGYTDPFLTNIKKSLSPIQFGNPAINDRVAVLRTHSGNDVFEMNTGKDDASQLRQIQTMNKRDYVTKEYAQYDGESVVKEVRSPWLKDVKLEGTDGLGFSPALKQKDSLTYFSYEFLRPIKLDFIENKHNAIEFLDVYRYKLNAQQFEPCSVEHTDNCKFYQSQPQGIWNLRPVQEIDIFVTKQNFLGAQIPTPVTIYTDSTKAEKVVANEAKDETYYEVEPLSGTLSSVQNPFQFNTILPETKFLDQAKDVYVPLVSYSRTYGASSQVLTDDFRDIKTLHEEKEVLPVAGYVLGAIFLVLAFLILLRVCALKISEVDPDEYYKAIYEFEKADKTKDGEVEDENEEDANKTNKNLLKEEDIVS